MLTRVASVNYRKGFDKPLRPPNGVANANLSKVCELNLGVYLSQGNLTTTLNKHDQPR